MADVKGLVDFTVEQTSVAVGDLLYVASAGTPAKVTYGNLVDNSYTYNSTMTVTGTINVAGGTFNFGGTENFVPKADASGNLVDGYGLETTLTDDDTKIATSGGVIDYANGDIAGPTASSSGTAIEFNSLPADTTEVTIFLRGVSLSGADNLLVQLSTGSTYATSGYTSTAVAIVNTAAGATSSTAGFVFTDNADSNLVTATIRLEKEPGSNAWLCDGLNRRSALALGASSGEVTLGGVLDGVRIVTTGSDTFDGGAVSIKYKRRAA